MKHFKLVFQNPHFMIVIDIFRQGYDAIESCKRDLKRDLYYCPLSLYFEVLADESLCCEKNYFNY